MCATALLPYANTPLLFFIAPFAFFALPASSTPQLCYTDANKLAPDYIVPCWTSHKTPHYSCCKVGNKCLTYNACYDAATGMTYQYGCTDPSFKDEHCPQKCGLDRQITNWVGLVYCGGGGGLPDKSWVCHHPDNCNNCTKGKPWDPQIQRFPPTTCGDLKHVDEYVAFQETSTLSDIVPLPVATDIPRYFSENADRWQATSTGSSMATATPSGTTLTTLSSTTIGAGPASGTASSTSAPAPSSSKSHKAGLVVGLTCGGVVLLVLIGCALWHYYIRPAAAYTFPFTKKAPPPAPPGQDAKPVPPNADGTSENPPAEPTPKYEAELSADAQVTPAQRPHTQISEMEGTPVDPSSLHTPDVSPLPSHSSWGLGGYGNAVAGANAGNVAERKPNLFHMKHFVTNPDP